MRRMLILGALLSWASSLPAAADPAPEPGFSPKDGETVVFLGDSITHQALYTQYIETFFYTRYPDRNITFHNAGVAGDKASDALERFETDVASLEPDFVTILLGMNDGQYEPFSVETNAAYRAGMRELLRRTRDCGATSIALSPTMFDHHQRALRKDDDTYRFREKPFDPDYNCLLSYFSAWLRQESAANRIPFVDLWTPLNELTFSQRRIDPDFTLVEDAIHPGAAGHFVMAYTILTSLEQERPFVSEIEMVRDEDGWTALSDGNVTDLEVSEGGEATSFTFRARSLPWRVPEKMSLETLRWGPSAPASLGGELTNADQYLNRESFRMQGLADGTYELRIDDVTIDTFSARQLSHGIELQRYRQSPQNRQALEVALLNRERNDEIVRPMRETWSRIKGARRKETPEQAAIERLGQEADAFRERAGASEDDLRAIARPLERRYTLTRIE